MGNYELIEELCSVARLQADIIQKQARGYRSSRNRRKRSG